MSAAWTGFGHFSAAAIQLSTYHKRLAGWLADSDSSDMRLSMESSWPLSFATFARTQFEGPLKKEGMARRMVCKNPFR